MKKNFGKAIYTLEFDKIREMLAEVAPTEGAAARALTLEPDTDIDRIRLELKKTTAAKKLIGEKGMPSFWGVYDPYSALDKVSKGAPMTAAELLRISSHLKTTSPRQETALKPSAFIFQDLSPTRRFAARSRNPSSPRK